MPLSQTCKLEEGNTTEYEKTRGKGEDESYRDVRPEEQGDRYNSILWGIRAHHFCQVWHENAWEHPCHGFLEIWGPSSALEAVFQGWQHPGFRGSWSTAWTRCSWCFPSLSAATLWYSGYGTGWIIENAPQKLMLVGVAGKMWQKEGVITIL